MRIKRKLFVFYLIDNQILGIYINSQKNIHKHRYLNRLIQRCKKQKKKFTESFTQLEKEKMISFFKETESKESTLSVIEERKPDYIIVCSEKNNDMYYDPAVTITELKNTYLV